MTRPIEYQTKTGTEYGPERGTKKKKRRPKGNEKKC
jgi:hypothetical protein